MNNKKGISDVVTTVLIVLLSIIAIAVVWSFISPLITKGGTQIGLTQACLNVNVDVIGCKYNGTNWFYNTTVKRTTSDSESLTAIKLIFTKADGTTFAAPDITTPIPAILGTSFYPGVSASFNASSVAIAEGITIGGVVSYCAPSPPVSCA